MTLLQAEIGKEYIVQRIAAEDEELLSFLFTLGCYSGEPITVIARRSTGIFLAIKDGRYTVDAGLAQAIEIA